MPRAAPRIDERLIAALARADDGKRAYADLHRQVGEVADALALPRPSYEQTRVVVHELRSGRRGTDLGGVLLDIAFRVKPPTALLDELAG